MTDDGLAEALVEAFAEGLADDLTEGLVEDLTEGLTDGLVEGLAEDLTVGLTKGLAEVLTDGGLTFSFLSIVLAKEILPIVHGVVIRRLETPCYVIGEALV